MTPDMSKHLNRSVFLDRDGILNRDSPQYIKSWGEFEWLPGALDSVVKLSSLDVKIIVITNQGAIGRGLTTRQAVDQLHENLVADVESYGGRIDAVYICPHRPSDVCDCRKPAPGLLLRAAREHGIDLQGSVMIGDHATDMEAAAAAGCGGVLVGRNDRELVSGIVRCDSLAEAVTLLFNRFSGEE